MILTINTNDGENGHFLKTHYGEVAEIMSDLGYDNDLIGLVTPKPTADVDMPDNSAITPTLSKPVRDTIQKCQLPFELDSEIAGCFGNGSGSANTTTVFEKTGMAISEAFEILEMTGQLEKALKLFEMRRSESDPDAPTLLAYAMATLSKGWRAEAFLNESDRFKTGSVSQDKGGLDLYDTETDEWVQLKPVTVVASNGVDKFRNKSAKHLFYMWTGDGNLKVADADSWKQMKDEESKKSGISGTLLIKSANLKINREYGRTFRFLWW